MFSKALFKQSCKANGTMWGIITAAVCFMLACVMLISGGGSIGEVKNSVQDTIIREEINAQMETRAINYFLNATDGLAEFDRAFTADATDTLSYLTWLAAMPNKTDFGDDAQYRVALDIWKEKEPQMTTDAGRAYKEAVTEWQTGMPQLSSFENSEAYLAALKTWKEASPATKENAVAAAYRSAVEETRTWVYAKALAIDPAYTADSNEAQEMLGSVMYVLNPNGMFNDFYTDKGEEAPADYDIMSPIKHIAAGDAADYLNGDERTAYRSDRAESLAPMFLAGNMTEKENVEKILSALASFGVTEEKYLGFGYTYAGVRSLAVNATLTYRARYDYELGILKDTYAAGGFADADAYRQAIADKSAELQKDIASSLLASLPSGVSDALEEVGKADLYTLIVGSIFYKLAGLLLPIIYMIMASNNLIAGQVDSGSMAYVLSTSIKRKTVVFTQGVYLVGSLFAMFSLTTVTGCICLAIVSEDVQLTYGKLLLLNLGAFLVLFALSGLCFFTSCYFDRSRRSMAIGGGLSIFALVAAMLGLFGSPVIPSVVRLDALNSFNYTTIISLFDVISIMDGTLVFLWKFAILLAVGIAGYLVGSVKFTRKDLPL